MSGWSIDLGTTHTRVAHWDEAAGQPRLLELPRICRIPGGTGDPLEGARLIPSATHVLEDGGFAARIGAWPPFAKRFFWGKQALVGRMALEENEGFVSPSFAPSFKMLLEREALRPLVRAGRRSYTVRDVARMYVREVLAEVVRETGERIREAAFTIPVDAYETYRAELTQIAKLLGVSGVKFVDEPVAAALGYGLSLAQDRTVLLIDFGGGTMHAAVAELRGREREGGRARVLAKAGRPIGGSRVDRWILSELGRRVGVGLDEEPSDPRRRSRFQLMLLEARRVKESLFFAPNASFTVMPDEVASFVGTERDPMSKLDVSRADLMLLLEQRGAYAALDECVDSVLEQAAAQGAGADRIQDVLMIGGSTLLPGVFPRIEARFGRDRVRAWQPFEAVAFGACAYAAGRADTADYIVHDYAMLTYDTRSKEPQYTVIVPRGTRFPTAPDLWKTQLVPTCALGEPEKMFKLIICEIGRAHDGDSGVGFDAAGRARKLAGAEGAALDERLIVPLNESDPTLGFLDPPQSPRDRRPRLEVSFGVNEDRWLVATVRDLFSQKLLLSSHPVVRLL